jgi:fatty-acyl-CoA synthase
MSPASERQGGAAAAATLTVGERFSAQARLRGSAIALEDGATRRSFAELDARSARLAGWLAAHGVRRGDRVAMLSENRAEYVELFLGAARLGAIVACQNWRQSDAELARCLALVEPVLCVVSARLAPTLARLALAADSRTLELGAACEAALAASPPLAARTDLDAEDGLLLLYTSGTTGAPKAALISHRAMLARSLVHALDRRTDPEAAFVAWTPFFHMGSTDASFATLMGGGKVIVMDGFDAEALVDVVVREPVGHLTIVPGVVERFLDAWKRRGATACGVGAVGVMADLVPPRWIAELTRALGAPYCNTFGSTETGSPPASRGLVGVGVAPERLPKLQSSLCTVRLLDAEGTEVPDGTPGELAMRGPTLFSGYWNAPEANAEVFRDGWYHMGDVLVRNGDGTLDYVDRKKYLIKSGGENIYPAEIERVLLALPSVAEAVVVRRADARWGEVPVAFVVRLDPALDESAVIDACRGVIANYKLPKEVRFIAADALPRNVSGKIERRRLEALLTSTDPTATTVACT